MFLKNIVGVKISHDINGVRIVEDPANMTRLLLNELFGHCDSLYVIGWSVIYCIIFYHLHIYIYIYILYW